MRATVLLLCLSAAVASAQPPEDSQPPPAESLTPPPMTSAPEAESPPPQAPAKAVPPEEAFHPPPHSTGPSESPGQRARRYSRRRSTGSGGPLLAVTESTAGLISGAMLGTALSGTQEARNSNGYAGAVLGGLGLGTAAIVYQYLVPVGRREGLLAASAATVGLMASLSLANSRHLNDKDRALFTLASTQAGVLSVLMLTAGGEDVSAGDAGLVESMSLYGFVLTGLVEYIHARQTRQGYDYVPLLTAPAIGMALGGLLAIPLELSSQSVFEFTFYPLGAGLAALLIGSPIADPTTVAKTVLGTVGGTFFLVALLNALSDGPLEEPEHVTSRFQALPVPVILSAGRDHGSLAAGPGLFMRF